MKKMFYIFTCVSLALVIVSVFRAQSPEAGVRDNVVLGEWQPTTGGQGRFLSLQEFIPGKKLAVKIFVEQPGETVDVKFMIEALTEPPQYLKKTVQDNGPDDLLPKEDAVILFGLGNIPDYKVSRYIVEVYDDSGGEHVIQIVEIPTEPSGLLERFGTSVANQAETLWNLPETLATVLITRSRGKLSLHELVIANNNGEILRVLNPIEYGYIESPVWLLNDQILFIQRHDDKAMLKVVSATNDEKTKDFGGKLTEGDDPHITPDGTTLIFRRGMQIMGVDLHGTEILPLIQEKEDINIWGVFPDPDSGSDNLVFSAKNPEMKVSGLWLAKIQGTKLVSLDSLPYDYRWELLAKMQLHEGRMLYEKPDNTAKGPDWNIYLSESPTERGKKISFDGYHDRYPSWSPNGERIVYASGEIKK